MFSLTRLGKLPFLGIGLACLVLVSGGARGASPLPNTSVTSVQPVLWLLIDNSISMRTCDGGTWNAASPPVPTTLIDPRLTPSDSPNGTLYGYVGCDADDDNDPGTSGSGAVRSASATVITLSRLEAMKIAVADFLDVNDDGAINASDDAARGAYLGFSEYDSDLASCPTTYCTRTSSVLPVGSTSASVWTNIQAVTFDGSTPHGAALAGARALGMAKCYDHDSTTMYQGVAGGCALPASELEPDGDDENLSCRPYYVLHLTDGDATFGNSPSIGEDGVPIAKRLRFAQYAYGGESGSHLLDKQIRVAAVGLGANVSGVGSDARAQINCQSIWGVDANLDGDNNPLTMDDDTNSATTGVTLVLQTASFPGTTSDSNPDTSADTWCNSYNNFNDSADVQTYYGNGFFANNVDELATALQSVLSGVTTGTFSGAEPTFSVNASGIASGNSVFSASYDVVNTTIERYGHLRKYRFDTTAGNYVNCDNASVPGGLPRPCWDAGGVMVVSSGGLQVRNESPAYGGVNNGSSTYATPGAQPANYLGGLSERNWLTRRIFLPNPAVVNGSYYDRDEYKDMTRRPDPASSARTIAPLIPSLAPLPIAMSVAQVDALPSPEVTNLRAWLAWASVQSVGGGIDTANTYQASDWPIPLAALGSAGNALMFAAGRPTATFNSGAKRCGSCLTDDVFSPKLGYPSRSRPIVIGPPAAFSTDSSYIGTPGVDDSGFLETVLVNGYTGKDAVIERDEAYSYGAGYQSISEVPANPCGEGFSGTCKVKLRRKVVYIGANDGAVHAFDEATGHELWAFIPSGMLRKLSKLRAGGGVTLIDGNATIRDVKFPLISGDRTADGKWHTVMIFSLGLGGRFYFALDVTNPVNPKFLWENFDDEIGYTVARPAIGELPAGAFNASEPGSIVFATGGMLPAGEGSRNSIMSFIRTWDGVRQGHEHSPREDLADSETAIPIQNGATGEPRAVDANNDGKIDRVYFGDVEGRMWKICNIPASGASATYTLFFDPALYDNPHATAPGYPDSGAGDSTPFGSLSDAAQRKQLRGPISFPPDITHDGTGNLLVAFGSGNIFDVLTPPAAYKNFLWVVEDSEAGGGAATCTPPTVSACAGNTGLNTVTITSPSNRVFNNVLALDELLTGPPQILAGFLVYPEFKRTTSSTCTGSSYLSRVVARDVFSCGTPATNAFVDPVTSTPNVITYQDTLVTGLQVDPSSGRLFLQTSTGTAPPQAVAAPGLASNTASLGFRQVY